jgi:lipopolysaccharide transport system ATP-binding protein
MSDVAIKVEGVGKKYVIGHQLSGDLRESFGQKIKNLLSKNRSVKEEFWALKDISFEIKQGEAVGIIGRNGAGKSTLLKLLSRITDPSTGRFEINGRVSSLLEVGTGFHPELTGRENIFLNGTILGMRRAEIKARFDDIVDFSGVEKFLDTPVKHYSSGMKVRLAFSVAAHLEPEILIVDEVLAVGDAEFQKKCLGKMEEVSKSGGRTVLFVSHNMGAVEALCQRGVLLNQGQVENVGSISEIVRHYLSFGASDATYISPNKAHGNYIFKAEFLDANGQSLSNFHSNEQISIQIETFNAEQLKNVILGVAIKDFRGNKLSTTIKKIATIEKGKHTHKVIIEKDSFLNGNFSCDIAYFTDAGPTFDYVKDASHFTIIDASSELVRYGGSDIGSVQLNTKWL